MGRRIGITERQLLELQEYETSTAFDTGERLVIAYAAKMTGTPVEVDDVLFSQLQTHFNEGQIVELTAAIAWENYRARFNHALGVPSQGFAEGAVCSFSPMPRSV